MFGLVLVLRLTLALIVCLPGSTLQNASDAVDVIYVYIGNGRDRAFPFAVKRNTSCGDCINNVCQRLLLVESARHLHIQSVDPTRRTAPVDIPDFKALFLVKSSYPSNIFVLVPKPGAPSHVARELAALNDAALLKE